MWKMFKSFEMRLLKLKSMLMLHIFIQGTQERDQESNQPASTAYCETWRQGNLVALVFDE